MVVLVVVERFWDGEDGGEKVNWRISQVDQGPPALGPYNLGQ